MIDPVLEQLTAAFNKVADERDLLRVENAALRKAGTVLSKQTFLQMACSCPWDEDGNPTHYEPCTGWSPSTDSSHAAIEAWQALTGPSQQEGGERNQHQTD